MRVIEAVNGKPWPASSVASRTGANAQRTAGKDDDLPFDAYLNFESKWPVMAVFDFDSLRTGIGSWGEIKGIARNDRLLYLQSGPARAPNELRCLWLRTDQLQAPPPRNLSEVSQHLNRKQRKGLERALSKRRQSDGLRSSGVLDFILFAWERRGRTDLLVMGIEGTGDDVKAAVLIAEPSDKRTLKLRAGPDAELLQGRRAVLFGAGALGGHVAVTLAESGIELLSIVDGDLLSPGNVVRHVSGHDQVGKPKVNTVQAAIGQHAPWTEAELVAANPGGRKGIAQLIEDADVVIDATGNEAFVYPVAHVAEEMGKPLVSGALYRGGFIGRVQRKALDADAPINDRPESANYPTILPGDSTVDLAEPDLGCSAPVNNAPPASVLACASLITQATIDVLTERFEFEDEVIDVYRPLPQAPFDRLGRYRRPSMRPA